MSKYYAANRTVGAMVGFERVRQEWQVLGENARYFFQTAPWIASVSRYISDDVVFGRFVDCHRPAAVSILRRHPRRTWRINILYGPGHLETFRLFADGLLAPAAEDRCSFDEIMRSFSPWDIIRLSRLRIESPWLKLADERAYVEEEPDEGVGVLDTSRDADTWRREMPKNMRDSIRKARRKAEKDGGSEVVVLTGGDVAKGFEQYVQLEASGRKGAWRTSLSHKPAWRSLLLDYLLRSETAEVRYLNICGRIAASQLSVRVGRTLFLLKVAYNEQLINFSPGNLLMANLVESCCEDPEIDRIDCTVWQPWHQRWGMARETTFRLTAFNSSSVRGAFAGIVWKATPMIVTGHVPTIRKALGRL